MFGPDFDHAHSEWTAGKGAPLPLRLLWQATCAGHQTDLKQEIWMVGVHISCYPSPMRDRAVHADAVRSLLRRSPVVALLGARQVGKTTLARELVRSGSGPSHFFDLESTADVGRLADPLFVLGSLEGLVVLDEVQRVPDLFSTLRVLADRRPLPARFLVLGSASPSLLRQTSESLAGRMSRYELPGFSLLDVPLSEADEIWTRGGFPESFLAEGDAESARWRGEFVQSFLERDLPQLGVNVPAPTLERFWATLAHYHGNVWNASEIGRSFGVSHHAVRRYLEALSATFMVRVLKPWQANLKKRQVKAPKVYFRDSGILHHFLDVQRHEELERHPKVGASWEGFVVENLLLLLGAPERNCFFWRAHTGGEVDLVVQRAGELRGFEVKRSASPTLTGSMRRAISDLGLSRLDVVHAGVKSYDLGPKTRAIAASTLTEEVAPLWPRG